LLGDRRDLGLREVAHARLQLLLVGAEIEVHDAISSLRAAAPREVLCSVADSVRAGFAASPRVASSISAEEASSAVHAPSGEYHLVTQCTAPSSMKTASFGSVATMLPSATPASTRPRRRFSNLSRNATMRTALVFSSAFSSSSRT